MTYAAGQLWEEVAYVAFFLHWPLATILDLEHPVRQRILHEVTKIRHYTA